MSDYGLAKIFSALERWGLRLIAHVNNIDFAGCADFRFEAAKGASNSIGHYGKAKDFDALERWGAVLIALAEHPDFKHHAELRLQEARGAINALIAFRDDGRAGSGKYNSWRTRLAKVALDFPYHGEIQLIARDWGLDYMEQRSRGWPFGKAQ
jgi:hypothetical protein